MTDLTFHTSELNGRITGLYGDVLQGWAVDTSKPDLRLVVEIYVDGTSVALVRADQFNPQAEGGDQFNGFAVQLRESWLATARVISACVANVDCWLVGTVQLPAPLPKEPAPAASQVWHTGGLKISGWAWDSADPIRAVKITVRDGKKVVCEAVADRLHHALTYRTTRNHGFELDLPWELADGRAHTLHIENDLGERLTGSPVTLCCWPEGVEALVRNSQHILGDQSNFELIANVVQHQEILLPKSASFAHYANWFKIFQYPLPGLKPASERCGVLIISAGDARLDAVSQSSIRSQRQPPLAINVTEAGDVAAAITNLLEKGCTSIIPVLSGDRLAAYALDHLGALLRQGAAWGYGDCDCDGLDQERTAPWLKPLWDIELFIGADIFSSGAIFSIDAIQSALRFAHMGCGQNRVTWHDFLAGVAVLSEKSKIGIAHLPRVIYHRHVSRSHSPAFETASTERMQAMAWLVEMISPGAEIAAVVKNSGLLRAIWPLPHSLPKVSIIIPTRDQVKLLRTCVEGVLTGTDYANIELIIVDNNSSDPETLKYLDELKARNVIILPHPHPFNYAAVNNRAADIATGELICLLNNDIEILESGWLKAMVRHIGREGAGIVGSKLLWSNGMVQHGGVIVGINGLAAHAGNAIEMNDPGYLGLNMLTHHRSSVTGACLLIHTHLYRKHKGMDEIRFPVAFNDVDLCLRVKHEGYGVIWVATSVLIHAESASRGKDHTKDKQARAQREQKSFTNYWCTNGYVDPTYHPSLSHDYLSGPYGGLSLNTNMSKTISARVLLSGTGKTTTLMPMLAISDAPNQAQFKD